MSDTKVECGGQVDKISGGAFTQKSSLQTIRITDHTLVSLANGVFTDLGQLTSVTMTNGHLEALPSKLFDHNTILSSIDFSFNRIADIKCTFEKNLRLRTVNFKNNKLTTMVEEVFKPMFGFVMALDLNANSLRCDCRMTWVLNVIVQQAKATSATILDSTDKCPDKAAMNGVIKCLFPFMGCVNPYTADEIKEINTKCETTKGNKQFHLYYLITICEAQLAKAPYTHILVLGFIPCPDHYNRSYNNI